MDTTFTKISFKKKDLKKIHPVHLRYIIGAAYAANEINSVSNYFIFEHRDIVDKPVEHAFVLVRQLALLRHVSAKIFEFNSLTSKYLGNARRTFPSFGDKWRRNYVPIARAIRMSLWLPTLRNKMAFHYDDEDYLTGFSRIADEQELSLFYGSKTGEIAFSFAENIVSAPLFYGIGGGDIRHGMLECARFSNRISSEIVEFVSQHQIEIFSQYGVFRQKQSVKADTKAYGKYDNDFIPIFTTDSLSLKVSDK